MYFTMQEIRLLLAKRCLREEQERLASIRLHGGDETQAANMVKVWLHRVAGQQANVDRDRASRTAQKLMLLERLGA